MPKTIQHPKPLRASVIFADGDSKLSYPLRCEQDANDWIDHQIDRYGYNVVATDIFPDNIH